MKPVSLCLLLLCVGGFQAAFARENPNASALGADEKAYYDLNLSRLAKEAGTLEVSLYEGGSDSGGGQGILDLKTGQLHFLDIFYPEELEKMQLSKNPEADVFAKFPSCTRFSSKEAHKRLLQDFDSARKVFDEISPLLEALTNQTWSGHSVFTRVTSLHLRQLKDATGIHPENQFQLAIYNDGIAFFQEQALALVPGEEIKWLFVKESLRFLAKANKTLVENADVEDAVRLLYHKDRISFLESAYVRKLMRPKFDLDKPEKLTRKKEYIESVLTNPKVGSEERALLKQDSTDIDFFFHLSKSLEIQYPEVFRYRWDNYLRDEAEKGERLSRDCDRGFVPAWALKVGENEELYESTWTSQVGDQGLITNVSTVEAPRYRAYDVETGKTVLDLLGSCSK